MCAENHTRSRKFIVFFCLTGVLMNSLPTEQALKKTGQNLLRHSSEHSACSSSDLTTHLLDKDTILSNYTMVLVSSLDIFTTRTSIKCQWLRIGMVLSRTEQSAASNGRELCSLWSRAWSPCAHYP